MAHPSPSQMSLSLDPLPSSSLNSATLSSLLSLSLAKLSTFPSQGWSSAGKSSAGKGRAKVDKYRDVSGEAWAGRLSVHPPSELNWEQVKDALYENHYEAERSFVHAFTSFSLVSPLDLPPSSLPTPFSSSSKTKAALFKLHYSLPFPLDKRTFLVALVQVLDDERGEVWNVSLPVEDGRVLEGRDGEKGRVRGRYVSIERVQRRDGGKVEWQMITLSNPSGNVPPWLTKLTVPGEIAKDVRGLLDHLHGA